MRQASATLILGVMLAATAPAVPLEPVAAIVDAFRTHRVVAVTAGHGETRGYAFGPAADPRSPPDRRDQRYRHRRGQLAVSGVADRFVNGDKVPIESLRHVWRDTTQPGLGHDREWEAFFQVVRALNASHAAPQRIRILLGDPPIEWEQVSTPKNIAGGSRCATRSPPT